MQFMLHGRARPTDSFASSCSSFVTAANFIQLTPILEEINRELMAKGIHPDSGEGMMARQFYIYAGLSPRDVDFSESSDEREAKKSLYW